MLLLLLPLLLLLLPPLLVLATITATTAAAAATATLSYECKPTTCQEDISSIAPEFGMLVLLLHFEQWNVILFLVVAAN